MKQITGGWVANLSDGSNAHETEPVAGEKSPWQQLLQRCREDEELRMTGLGLHYGPISIMAMPKQMCDGYFQAREVHEIVYRQAVLHRHGVGSVVGDMVYINWIEFAETGQVKIYSEVRPLETCRIHTTMN